jgi:hypothetical protein
VRGPERELGAKLGPKLRDLLVQGAVAAQVRTAPYRANAQRVATQKLIDAAGLEVADLMRPHIQKLLDSHDATPEHLQEYLGKIASGKHQWQAIMGAFQLSGAGATVATLVNNDLAPVVRAAIRVGPELTPTADILAQMVKRDIISVSDGIYEAAGQGYNSVWFERMLQLASVPPDLATLLMMVNRHLIPVNLAQDYLRLTGYAESTILPLMSMRHAVLAPADAALAQLRGNMSPAAAREAAAASGYSAADFDVLVGNTGDPLDMQTLSEALRRGVIDTARFERGIRQGRTRNEWIDVALALRFAPMSIADAIMATVQGHIPKSRARQIAQENGLQAEDFDPLYETAGEPLARSEMATLWNRGLATEAEFKQAMRESRTKNKYVDMATGLRHRIPEEGMTLHMLTTGIIKEHEAIDLLRSAGYAPDIAKKLAAQGAVAKVATHKAVTESQVKLFYIDQLIPKAEAVKMLAALGYSDRDVKFIVATWDMLAAAERQRQAVGLVRSRYVARLIEKVDAVTALDQLQVVAAARESYLKIWDIERAMTIRRLSQAQVVQAVKHDFITAQDGLGRLLAMGYDEIDAAILLGVKLQ